MKHRILFSIMFLFVVLYVPATFSDNPAYPHVSITLANDIWDGHMVYEVDIYLLGLDGTWELATVGQGIGFNNSALGTGTVTATWVPGSSELTNTTQIPTSLLSSTTALVNSVSYRLIRIVGKTPPGTGGGSIISNIAPGTKLGRLRLTNTVDFVDMSPGIDSLGFAAQTQYPAACNAYVNALNVNLTQAGNVTNVRNLAGPLLPVELSTFKSNVNGRQVNLNWETKTEIKSSTYQIERSLVSAKDATWIAVGNVPAAGTSNSPKKYSFTEKNLQAGKYQYRLKMIDNDGSFKYSPVVETEVAVPKDFAISQNYPNPFNPTTKIDYQVPVDAKVILEVYSITGQKVVELVNQDQSAGFYSVNFGTSNRLSSGVYIYRIIASDKVTGNNFSSIKKMMLLK